MKNKMDKGTKMILICAIGLRILYILFMLWCVFILRYRIIKYVNNTFLDKKISVLDLTKDQKVEDFEEFYNNIVKSVPLLNDQKSLYNTNFEDKKEYYLDLVKKTKNDFEFFCVMKAIQEDIPSMHTDIYVPIYSNISSIDCYNAKQTLAKYNIKPLTEYWYECIGKACEEFSKVQNIEFRYIDGQYLLDPMYTDEKYGDLKRFELVGINNQPMNDYIVDKISTYKLMYDFKRKVPYREHFTLNDTIGEKVNVTLVNSDTGDTIIKELYFDIKMEIVSTLSGLYEKDNQKSRNINDANSIYSYFDYKNDIGYVQVKDFMNLQGKKLLTTLESMKEFSSIIIDLRDNYGGLRNYGIKYLYAPIYNDSVTVTHNWFIPDSDSNKVINNAALNRFVYCTDKNESGFYYTRKYTYKGESTQTKQSIYYLINRRTGSAADGYIAMIKENNLGTIVGSNSRGEGLADSFYRGSLKHSGLVYIYFPSLCYNKDGTNNSVYGTKPDIYINKTKESFYKEKDLQENGIDINIYTERIKYDNVLIKTIEMIQ